MTLNSRSFTARTLVELLDVARFQRRTSRSHPNRLRHDSPAREWTNYRNLLENLTAVSIRSGSKARRDCNGAMVAGELDHSGKETGATRICHGS
ncbi:hypothetical protein NL676_011967 [Syzygium grande]|nr:hypothetical protein NL676_011967 [Syzygium grande]